MWWFNSGNLTLVWYLYIVHIQSSLIGLIMSHLAVFPPVQGLSDSAPDSYLDIAFNYHDFKRFSRLSLLFTVPRFLKSAGQYFVKFPSIWFCFMFSYDQAYFFFFFLARAWILPMGYSVLIPHMRRNMISLNPIIDGVHFDQLVGGICLSFFNVKLAFFSYVNNE